MARADLFHLTACTPAREGERRVGAGQQDQPHLERHALDKQGDHVEDRLGLDQVEIIQNEHKRASLKRNSVEDGVHAGFGGCFLEHPGSLNLHGGDDLGQGPGQVLKEPNGIIVTLVERKPAGPALVLPEPAADQRRLAIAGRRRNEDETICIGWREPVVQAGPRYESGTDRGNVELGAQEVDRHSDAPRMNRSAVI